MERTNIAMTDRLSEQQIEILQLFENELADVQFPGLDINVLHEAVEQVAEAAKEVEAAEAALALARGQLEAAQEALSGRCAKAVSYARVYADGNEALSERLAGLQGVRARSALGDGDEGPRKRRRARTRTGETSLFESTPVSEMPSA